MYKLNKPRGGANPTEPHLMAGLFERYLIAELPAG